MEINKQRLIQTFIDLVKIDSPSGNEKLVAEFLENYLREIGGDCIYDNASQKIEGDSSNLIVKFDGIDEEPVILCCHMDTVPPCIGIEPVVKDNRIVSSGDTILGSDDKAGIACIIEAVKCCREQNIPHRSLELVFTVSEETGLLGAKNLDYSLLKGKTGLILDSSAPLGSIVCLAPYQDSFSVEITGKASHAGICPEKGISAIQVASKAISRMRLLRIDEDTTANIGTISGGTATNIVPEKVYIKGEARSVVLEKLDLIIHEIRDIFADTCERSGAKLDFIVHREYCGYVHDPEHSFIKEIVSAHERAGVKTKFIPTGGGSDTNVFSEKGIMGVNISAGMQEVHTTSEFIEIDDLQDLCQTVFNLIRKD